MAEAVAPNSFENLQHNGIVRINAKDDRNVSLSIGTYGGNTSVSVSTGAGGKPWSHTLPRKTIHQLIILLKRMRAQPITCREPVMISKFEEEIKKYKPYGQMGFGIDESLNLYIDIAANDLQGRHLFPFRADGRFDFSNTTMTEKDHLIAHIDWLIESFQTTTVMAERLSSFKRTNTGGARSGGYSGGNKSGGNYNGGGGNYNRQQAPQQSSFGGAPDVESDLHI